MYSKYHNPINRKFYFSLIFILSAFLQNIYSQALPDSVVGNNDTILFFMPGNFKYKIPNNCVTSITVQVWGASGAGTGVASGATNGGGGGGGGAFSSATFTVTPGTTYNLTVGNPGAGGTGSGGTGADSWFGSTTTVMAKGGTGSSGTNGGAGGAAASGVGSVKYSGGTGGTYTNDGGGGGGASAGPTGNGANGSNGNGSNGGAGGVGYVGSGGAGGSNNGPGQDNSQCSGCGGGGGVGTNGGNGGSGSGGLIKIILPPPLNVNITGSQTICPGGTPSTFIATATGASGGPYSYAWLSSITDSISGFSPIGGGTSSTYSSGALSVTTWYRCIANAGNCLPDTSNTINITVTNLSGTIAFPQTICTGSTPSPLTITTIPSTVAATYTWQSSTTGSGSGFSPIGGATASNYAPGAVAASTWYNAIISATGCVTYTTTALSVTTSNAPATCNAGNTSTIYSTNVLPLTKSSVGGSVTTGAWSVFSSTPASTPTLSSTAQTTDPASVTFTPQAGFNGTVVLALTINSNGCNASVCKKTINIIPATLTTLTFTNTGASTWTVPGCVSTVTVQTWGAGAGGGSGGGTFDDDGSGGGGGAFSSSVLSVTQSTVYNYFVGAGGIGAVHTTSGKNGTNGGDSWFGSPSTVSAQGGIGGLGVNQPGYGNPSPGGLATAGHGTIKYNAGVGASGCLWAGGGGGGSGCPTTKGTDAPLTSTVNNCNASSTNSTPGATACTGGGYGGDGGESQGPAISGTCSTLLATPGGFPGGGGGGGTNACDQPGQNGGNGQVVLVYGPSLPVIIFLNSATICSGQSAILKASTDFPISYKWSTGATADSIIVSPTVNTSYTVTDAGGCASPVTVTVTVNAAFAASATSTTICSGQAGTITATGATSYLWSTGATTNTITTSPSVTTPYTVAATKNGCSINLTGTISVNSSASLFVNSASICAGQNTILNATGATSFSWAPNTNLSATTGSSVTANPSSDITYTVTGTTNNCVSTTTSAVTVNQIPISNAGNDITICTGATGNIGAPLTAGYIYSWSPATGLSSSTDAAPAVTLTNVTANPIVSSYSITTTSAAGCLSTDVVNVTVKPKDNAAFSYTPATVCKVGGSDPTPSVAITSGGIYSCPDGNLTLNVNTGVITLSLTPTATYTVTYITSGTCPDTSTAIVSIVTSPNATFSYAGPYCQNVISNPTPVFPIGSSAGAFSSSAGLVFVNTATGVIDLSASTPAAYTVTNFIAAGGGCSAATSTNTITINAVPITTVNNTTVCAGTQAILTASGANAYVWSDASNTNPLTINPAVAATYTVTGTTAGCSSTAQGTVTVTPLPTSTFTVTNVCVGNASAIGYTGNPLPNATYNWNFAGGTTLSGSGIGPYSVSWATSGSPNVTLTVTDGTCVSPVTTVPVTVNATPTVTAGSAPICQGSAAIITASGANSYLWSDGSTTNPLTVAVPVNNTSYTVTGTTTGCSGTGNATLSVNPMPTSTFSVTPVCVGAGSAIGYTGNAPVTATYTWNFAGGTTISGSGQGPYSVSWSTPGSQIVTLGVSIGTCNSPATTMTVTVNPAPVVNVNSALICLGQTATLTANGAASYLWSDGSTTNPLIVSPITAANTSYTVTGTSLGCSAKATTFVDVTPLPNVTVNTASACPGQTVILTASGATTYSWSTGSIADSTSVGPLAATPSSFTVSVTGTGSGCSNTAIGAVTVFPIPTADFSFTPNPAGVLNPVITFTDKSSAGVNYWNWSFGDGDSLAPNTNNPIHTYPNIETTYTVTLNVQNTGKCSASKSNEIIIGPEFTFYIPNAFSPNNDQINDVFGGSGGGIVKYQLLVFDRWGNLIFTADDISKTWDGKANGGAEVVQQDVFIWKAAITDIFKKEHSYIGTVTLVNGK